ncbi:hypothetical protein QR680_011122 [Steinernema hermaphroditum]|uniref:7TM GPCR serpentine receptor class x (Srx) domain-containing protein n=1 Tax=Steinernema hermaphroditum TaxID=289476 RepID=A0AA39ISP0_9BILA|nr:hypothetical protein QR680_011122 [Steinernema hermaphroditum]
MNASGFVYGSELQGRGYATQRDLIFGYITTLVSVTASFGAVINLHVTRQTTNIPAPLGIFAYQLSFTFTYIQCVMNLAIAANRFIAVCYPLQYKSIFNKRLCVGVALFVLFQALFVVTLYFSTFG